MLRNINDYIGIDMYVEGVLFQNVSEYDYSFEYLLIDDSSNIYHIQIREPLSNFNPLIGDRVRAYGAIAKDPTYEYESFSGKQMVPSVYLDFIDLIE